MRRIALFIVVAALMAAMLVSAGPAWANNTGSFTNQQGLFSVGDEDWWSGDDGWWSGGNDWWSSGGGISFTIGDSENESGDISFR